MSVSPGSTREELMQFLSTVPSSEILSLLEDNIIAQLAARHYTATNGNAHAEGNWLDSTSPIERDMPVTTTTPSTTTTTPPPPPQEISQGTPDRAKRPLNAFMAFRTYYIKLFPEIQQKSVSGFLTTLWNRDPCRNKWALIAKVYSFVRDEVGKSKVPLSSFLKLSCPIMSIIDPTAYLSTLGWSIRQTHDGQKLVQDEGLSLPMDQLQASKCPNTEVELLSAITRSGYLPAEGFGLLERMKTNTSGLMTTSTRPVEAPISYISEKAHFINTIRLNPIQATKDLLGAAYDDEIVHLHGLKVHSVSDMNSISHLSMQPVYPHPVEFYNFSNAISPPTEETLDMPLNGVADYSCIDIDNPFDLDAVLGYDQPEGERTVGLPPSPPFDHEEDFQILF